MDERVKRAGRMGILIISLIAGIVTLIVEGPAIRPIICGVPATVTTTLLTPTTTTLTTTSVSPTTFSTTCVSPTTFTVTSVSQTTFTTTYVSPTTFTTIPTRTSQENLLVRIVPEHGWSGILPTGDRFINIPANRSETFSVYINNTGQTPIEIWGMLVLLEYADLTFSTGHQQVLGPGEGTRLEFIFGTNIPRPPGVDSVSIVFRILGNGWIQDETAIIYLGH